MRARFIMTQPQHVAPVRRSVERIVAQRLRGLFCANRKFVWQCAMRCVVSCSKQGHAEPTRKPVMKREKRNCVTPPTDYPESDET
jgi:hypothetical protein